MKKTIVAAMLCLTAGAANAQPNNQLKGSETLARFTRRLITDLTLTDLTYVGGGTTLGIRALTTSRGDVPTQRVAPASRPVTASEIALAAAANLTFVDYVVGLDAVVIHVNDVGNPGLTRMRFSDARSIYRCEFNNWAQVPGSLRSDGILALAQDELHGTTTTLVRQVGGFTEMPADNWWSNYPCITVCVGDGCTQLIADITATTQNAVAFSDLRGLETGNHDLSLCNDTNPVRACADADYVQQSPASIRDSSYPLSRRLRLYSVTGTDGFGPNGSQAALLAGAQDPTVACPALADSPYILPVPDFCP